ncbi:MAG: hypothetical protein ACRD0O_15140, partial [Acidimicrobiia bacterium]
RGSFALPAAGAVAAAAVVVGAQGRNASAMRILGAAESVRQESGETGRWGPLATAADGCRDGAEQALGRTAADDEWRQGRQMTLDAGLAHAIQALDDSPSASSRGWGRTARPYPDGRVG